MATDKITSASIADDIISGKTALGAEPADTDEFLVSDAGTLKRVDYSYIKASPGLNFISNTALSSAGYLDITSVFSSTYANYRIIGSGLNMATDNNAWVFQLRTDSAVTNTSYWWAGVGQRDSGSAVDDGETNTTDWRIIGNCANTGQALNFDMTVYRPNLGLYTSYTCIAGGRRSGGGGQVLNCGGYQNTTTQFTGFRILVDSGNISAGNITVFGLSDS